MEQPIITIVGSINMDMIIVSDKFPSKGETVIGQEYHTKPGGKGANQAIAVARLGAQVHMIGMVGDDQFGKELLSVFEREKVSIDSVHSTNQANTGTGTIILSDNDNRIIVVQGANRELKSKHIIKYKEKILKSDLVLIQFEIPLEVIQFTINLCYENDIPIIINPAPARELPHEYWLKATYITPNETEELQLFNGQEQKAQLRDKLIVTKGENGVFYWDNQLIHVPAYEVVPVDTTGAGDTFNGALAVAIAEEKDLIEAVKFANAAAALSILKVGAQEGMPVRVEVEEFMEKWEEG